MSVGDYSKPTFSPGETLTAAKMQAIVNKLYELDQYAAKQIRYVKKASDETINNSAAFQDDNDINITFPAKAAVYKIELYAYASGVDAGNFKSQWVISGGTSAVTYRHCFGPTPTDGDVMYLTRMQVSSVALTNSVDYGLYASATPACIREEFIVSTTASASTLKWQWAQYSATVGNTTVSSNTHMVITEIMT